MFLLQVYFSVQVFAFYLTFQYFLSVLNAGVRGSCGDDMAAVSTDQTTRVSSGGATASTRGLQVHLLIIVNSTFILTHSKTNIYKCFIVKPCEVIGRKASFQWVCGRVCRGLIIMSVS